MSVSNGLGIDPSWPLLAHGDVRVRGVTASRIPHTSSARHDRSPCSLVSEGGFGSGFPEAEGWVTIPFSAIQFSGSAVSEAVGPVGLSRRWGWVSSPPRGPCQAEVRSASERDRTSFRVSSKLARSDGGGRHPWLGDYGAFRCRGPPKTLSCRPLVPDVCGPRSRSVSVAGGGCYGSLGRKQEIFARKFENVTAARIRGRRWVFGEGCPAADRLSAGGALRKSDRSGQGSTSSPNGDRA